MSEASEQDGIAGTVASQVDHLQEIRPVTALQGHEVCSDIHTALSVAQAVLDSRNKRVADPSEAESGDALLRELRALGVEEAAPQIIAMVALVDTAVNRLADAGAMTEGDAWEQIRKDVIRRHCQAPDAL